MFFGTVAVAFALLYLPGYLFFRPLRCARLLSFLIAPIFSLAGYSLVVQICSMIDQPCSGMLAVAPVFLVAICCFVASRFIKKKASLCGETSLGFPFKKGDWKILLLLLGISFCLCVGIYVKDIDGASGFLQAYDNYSHLGVVRAFLDSGNYSVLSTTLYPNAMGEGDSPWGASSASFYPALFYAFSAIVISLLGCPVTLGINAVIVVTGALLFPASMFLLLRKIFQEQKYLLASSLCVMAFASFPWGLFVFGPLTPNLFAFSLLPLILSLVMAIVSSGFRFKERMVTIVLALVGCIVVAIAHPNAIFAAYLLLTVFFARRIYQVLESKGRIIRWGSVVLFLMAFLVGWYAMYKLPALQGIINFTWGSLGSKSQVLADVLAVAYTPLTAPQWLLAFLTALGVITGLFRREYLWVSLTYILIGVVFVLGCSSDGFLKHFLIGFWYTDPYRIAAILTISAIPVAAMGMVCFCDTIKQFGGKFSDLFQGRENRAIGLGLFGVLFLLLNFYPSVTLPNSEKITTTFGAFHERMAVLQSHCVDYEEMEFMKKVREVVGQDAVIINDPYDGSAFFYGADGLDLFYRQFHGYYSKSETESSIDMREHLADAAENEEVAKAILQTKAQYVLLLDAKEITNIVDTDQDTRLEEWDPTRAAIEYWEGLYRIEDDTKGFELILSDGDMRLYKIISPE